MSGSLKHLAGFAINDKRILAYPHGFDDDLEIYYENTGLIEGFDKFTKLNFTNFDAKSAIGVSFDSFTNVFSVYFMNQIRRFTINDTFVNAKVRPVSRETNNQEAKDRVKFNFGDEKFSREIPVGYTPWCRRIPKETCAVKTAQRNLQLYIAFLLLSS